MSVKGPILVIEDDVNDADAISTAIRELGVKNQQHIFHGAREALDYLLITEEKPMIILCDIRMPFMDGLAFLKSIHENEYLRKKSIPFVYFTGVVTVEIINEAYNIGVQGFYKKAVTYTALKDQLLAILVYWKQCLHPNSDLQDPN